MAAIAHDLLGSEELARNGRSARTLAKSKGMTAVLTAVRAGGGRFTNTRRRAPSSSCRSPGRSLSRDSRTVNLSRWARAGRYSSDKAKSTGFRPQRMPRSSCLSDSSPEEAEKQETVPAGRGVGVVGDGNTAGVGSPPQQIPGLVSDRPPKTGLRPCSGSFLTPVMLGIVSLASY